MHATNGEEGTTETEREEGESTINPNQTGVLNPF